MSTPPQAPSDLPTWSTSIDRLYANHRELVRASIRKFARRAALGLDPERLADLEQDVWCRLVEGGRVRATALRGDSLGEARVYLKRVVASVVVDHLRTAFAQKRRPTAILRLGADEIRESFMADWRDCPERRCLAREEIARYLDACRALLGKRVSPVRVRIVRLAWIGGLTSPEIARRIGGGWTAAGVDSLLHRLRRRLVATGLRLPARAGRMATDPRSSLRSVGGSG